MTHREIRETIRNSTFVVLLDNTPTAHRLSSRIFRRFGVSSYIYGKKRVRDLFDFSSHTLCMGQTDCERLRAEELVALADSQAPLLPLLVPCSAKARAFASRHAELLESRYLLPDPRTLFSASPLTAVEQRLHAVPHRS